MAAQAAHASLKVFLDRGRTSENGFHIDLTDPMKEWLNSSFTKICVGVSSEQELLEVVEKARAKNLPVALIQDEGRTEFHGVPTYTCCAIGPDLKEEIDQITGHLPLL